MATQPAGATPSVSVDSSNGMAEVQKAWDMKTRMASEIKRSEQQMKLEESEFSRDLQKLAREKEGNLDQVVKQVVERHKAWSEKKAAHRSRLEALGGFLSIVEGHTAELAAKFPGESLVVVRRRLKELRLRQRTEQKNVSDLKKEIQELKDLRDQLKAPPAAAPAARKAKP